MVLSDMGYGADICYAVGQASDTLAPLENQNFTMHWGLIGTYERHCFTPKHMEDADPINGSSQLTEV
ncbi:hypothetical protein MF1_10130 [Bartonella quintana]|nr:hypothetical protein MF1_10130 [Bartonella quintana]